MLPPHEQSAAVTFGPFTFDRSLPAAPAGDRGDPPAAARARRPRAPSRARRGHRAAPGDHRHGLEGRVRHRHVARRGRSASCGRRSATTRRPRPTSRPSIAAGYRFVAPVAEASSRTTPAPLSTAPDEVTKRHSIDPSVTLVPWGIAALCTWRPSSPSGSSPIARNPSLLWFACASIRRPVSRSTPAAPALALSPDGARTRLRGV